MLRTLLANEEGAGIKSMRVTNKQINLVISIEAIVHHDSHPKEFDLSTEEFALTFEDRVQHMSLSWATFPEFHSTQNSIETSKLLQWLHKRVKYPLDLSLSLHLPCIVTVLPVRAEHVMFLSTEPFLPVRAEHVMFLSTEPFLACES
ncbi:unnamed protein product [Timema podura]|uniref:Uncharacterized protein n=1 Tax=Timema podura TaxID=61482 RepID=A0ABN7NK17_TIMPD|nr:unnamed protein product [Timema podura]